MSLEKKPQFVRLVADDFFSDAVVQGFSITEFGCYLIIILYLYSNGGVLANEKSFLKKLCRNPRKFDEIWDKIKCKFLVTEKHIKHKRVDEELARAAERMTAASERGHLGAEVRWNKQSSQAEHLDFYEKLISLIPPRSSSDRSCFKNVANWLKSQNAVGQFNGKIYQRVLEIANEATTAKKPAAAFMAKLKKELDYGRIPQNVKDTFIKGFGRID